ncbi:carbohydrate ABC transporter permease [Acidaminobacter sp. JC074]|uniref:carbohydrate ABC transporter permease n=1 Tax=Acidaminobacter sp. JC074 TaxID=2530199 RepID=UPI001F0FD616|nr:sugar ABC transporter permease [Acidaminobacter sp. JC074]
MAIQEASTLKFQERRNSKISATKLKKNLTILLMISPSLIVFSLFIIYPLVVTVIRSGFEFNGYQLGNFIGIDNYVKALTDEVFWRTNFNTLKMLAVQLLVCGPLSYMLAVLINNRPERFRKYFKIAVFLPAVLNVAVIALMWKMMFQPEWGTLDVILRSIGLERFIIPWLTHKHFAIWIIGFVVLWQYIGFNMLYFYAGLRAIPNSYYEAAEVAGASFWQKTKSISIPLTQEMIKFVLIISITGTMQIFTQIQLMTNGGPGDLTRSLVYQMYYTAFKLQDFGLAGAISVIFAIETFLMVLLVNRFVARERIELK